jgi:uncharacterized protein (DUF58 family)
VRRLPLSPAGWAAAALSLASAVVGVALGQAAVVGAAATTFAAVLLCLLFRFGHTRVDVRRLLRPGLVEQGSRCTVELLVINRSRRRLRRAVGQDHIGHERRTIDLPALDAGEAGAVTYELVPAARGVLDIGPLVVGRADPLGFTIAGDLHGGVSRLVVHPRVHDIVAFPAGVTRDLDGATSGEAPQGGVAFHSLRAYEWGDDLRLIHWKSSARTGELMVRHNVDVIQPRPLVYVDVRPGVHPSDAAFETALEAATSIVWSSVANGFPCLLRLGNSEHTLGCEGQDVVAAGHLLEALASAAMADGPGLEDGVRLAATGLPVQSVAVVSGARVSADELALLSGQLGRYRGAVVVLAGGDPPLSEMGGCIVVPARTGRTFAEAWNRLVR